MESCGFAGPIKLMREYCKMISSTALPISFEWLKTSLAERVRDLLLLWLAVAGAVQEQRSLQHRSREELDREQVVHIPPTPAESQAAVRRANDKTGPYFIPAAIIQINQ